MEPAIEERTEFKEPVSHLRRQAPLAKCREGF